MKRTALLLLTLLTLCCSSSFARTAASAFTVGEPHASTLAFRLYFNTMTAAEPPCTLSIAQRVYDPEQAEALLTIVRSDLAAISDCTGVPVEQFQPHTVYIVERLVNGSIERQGNRVYCRAQDVLSGTYRPLLICAALGTEEYWIGAGLAGCIWGSDADEHALSAYYADAADLGVLSLSVLYFIDDFSTEEEMATARATAVALCRFALEQDGCSALLTDDGVTLRRRWLASIGVDRHYDDPCWQALRQYRFRASATCSLIAVDAHGNTIYLSPMPDVATATSLRWFLHDLLACPEALLACVEAETPAYASLLRSRYGGLRIHCGQDSSWAIPEYREIHLALGAGYMHELTHILVPPIGGANFYTTMWQYEGLCYWAGYQAAPMRAQQAQMHQALHLFADMPNPQTPNHRFSTLAVELYLQDASLPESPNGVDVARYAHAMALVPLRWPDAAPDSAWTATIHDSYPALQNANGNELTDYQSFSFTSYLIDRHGLAAFLDFCTGGLPFDAAFGAPYESEHDAWMATLNAMFD